MGMKYHKPWNKDPVIQQPVFQWNVSGRFVFCGSIGTIFHPSFTCMFPITNGDTSSYVKLREGNETSRVVESSRKSLWRKVILEGFFFFGGGYVKISVQDG